MRPSSLGRLHDAVTTLGLRLAQVCLLLIVFAYCYETVARYFFNAPTWWSNELVGYALCIGTFLAFPEVTRRGSHIAITFLLDYLPQAAARRAGVAIALVAAAGCLLVAWICFQANLQHLRSDEMLVRVRPIPKIWISAFLTYGFASSGLYFLRQALAAAPPADTKAPI